MGEDSVKSTIKNDIKTSFLIANTFNALVGGLFPVTVGTGWFVTEGCIPPLFYGMAVGVPMFALSALGFYAAFKENKKMANAYSVLIGLVAAAETLLVAAPIFGVFFPALGNQEVHVYFCIFHTGIVLVAMASAMYLAKQLPSVETPITSSGHGFCKWLLYGLLGVLALGYFVNYFSV
ncbi:uncharacterized protein LOC134671553 [Cydia fagiglandana]|uniref:uncharacterized protein LOC134671553 n=1 Tax=Cydia fagiglandana TaxID=1458189 RepID=UPI002FEE4CD9